jgi:hypothetical protein
MPCYAMLWVALSEVITSVRMPRHVFAFIAASHEGGSLDAHVSRLPCYARLSYAMRAFGDMDTEPTHHSPLPPR